MIDPEATVYLVGPSLAIEKYVAAGIAEDAVVSPLAIEETIGTLATVDHIGIGAAVEVRVDAAAGRTACPGRRCRKAGCRYRCPR